jgi:four helix bundle protein
MKNFKGLLIWQRGIQITKLVYQQLKNIPQDARYELGFQLIRSAISISSNIAEGSSRSSSKDYKRLLEIALGSSFELETQMIILREITGENEGLVSLLSLIDEEQKMLMSFMNKVAQSSKLTTHSFRKYN